MHIKFRVAGSLLKIPHTQHDYEPVAIRLSLDSLVDRQHSLNLQFLKSIQSGKTESPTLLYLISFKVPQRSALFSIPLFSTKNMLN